MNDRRSSLQRETRETKIMIELCLDGNGDSDIDTGIGLLNHMLATLAKHAQWSLKVRCAGDLHVDDHHTSEDIALALGQAFDQALGQRRAIWRFGYAYAPLDEALARVVIDISSRPFAQISLNLRREQIGTWACENIAHFFQSFAFASRMTLHIDVLKGENDHHKVESAFKALAIAIQQASAFNDAKGIPSTKGML